MTTSLHHYVKKSDAPDQFMPFDPNLVTTGGQTINTLVGESAVWWDSTNKYIRPLSDNTNDAYFAGIVMDSVPANYGSIAVVGGISPSSARNVARVSKACQMFLKATGGDAINPNAAIYVGADAQTMTTAVKTNKMGYVDPEQAVVASATAGQLILCRVRANYPATPIN
jgi:hypothetical protein